MRLACVSPTDQGICAGLSRWGTVSSCVSGSIAASRRTIGRGHACSARRDPTSRILFLTETPGS
eukprot:6499479-Prymnesium_polylepis.1